jgi:hypothetical protein
MPFDYRRSQLIRRTILDVFTNTVIPVARQEVQNLSDEMADDLRRRLETQQFHHKPLKPDYLANKISEGLDSRILIATQEYLDAIQSRPLRDGSGWKVGVGDGVHASSGLLLKVLARTHEFGFGNVPARPHWRPMVSIWKRGASANARQIGSRTQASFTRAVRQRLG